MTASMNTIGIALVWCTVQVSLLGFLAAGLYLLVRRLRPAAAASVVLCSMTMVVVLSLLALSPWPRWIEPRAARSSGKPAAAVGGYSSPIVANGGTAAEAVRADQSPLLSAGEEATARPSGPAATAAVWQAFLGEMAQPEIVDQQSVWRWPAVAAMALLTAMACGLGWLVMGMIAVRRQQFRSRPVQDAELLELVDTLRAELGCRRPVELRQADDLATAATIGWRRPVLLLPADWTTWTADQRRAVLAHEIAHARSQDFLALLFGQLGLVLHFYHPLLHWLMNRLRLEQELAADAAAASVSGGQRQYLTTIAELALCQQGRPLVWPARAFLPTQTTFLRRIAMLRDSKLQFGRLSSFGRASTIVAVLMCGFLVAGLRGSGGLAPARADDAAKPVDTADESIDTTFLSEKARAMIIVRPTAVFAGPEMAELARLLESTGNAVPQGTHLADFRQITVLLPERPIPSGSRELVAMQWVKPVAEAYLMQHEPKEGYTIKEAGGKKLYIGANGRTRLLYDDHTLVETGSEQVMDAYLAEKRGVLPEWMPAAAWESFRRDHVVMGASAAQVQADMMIATKMPPALRTPIMAMTPLWQDSLGMAAGARLDGTLTVHGWLGAKDAESAAKARDMANAMRTLLQAASISARESLQPPAPPKPMATMLLDMADRLLGAAKLQQEDTAAMLETSCAIDNAWLNNLVSAINGTFTANQAARDPNTQEGLMLLVEDFFQNNYRDITSRETIEWGEPEKTAEGNFSIRYKYRAKIWDKATVVNDEIFTFNKEGDYVSVKKLPYDVSTREGIGNLVEDFFVHNYRDITSRETIEWGEPTKTADGNFTIRYKYRAKIWDKETIVNDKVFTFDKDGKFVSVKNVE